MNDDVNRMIFDCIGYIQNSLLMHFPYFERAFEQLENQLTDSFNIASDGRYIYLNSKYVLSCFSENSELLTRQYLHTVLHCIFQHRFPKYEVNIGLWNLACDIAVENILQQLNSDVINTPVNPSQRNEICKLEKSMDKLTAENIYDYYTEHRLIEKRFNFLTDLFKSDEHEIWYESNADIPLDFDDIFDNDDESDEIAENNTPPAVSDDAAKNININSEDSDNDNAANTDNSEDTADSENNSDTNDGNESDDSCSNGSSDNSDSNADGENGSDVSDSNGSADSNSSESDGNSDGSSQTSGTDNESSGSSSDNSNAGSNGNDTTNTSDGIGNGNSSSTSNNFSYGSDSSDSSDIPLLSKSETKKIWKKIAKQTLTQISMFNEQMSNPSEGLVANIKEGIREEINYTDFLRQFAVYGEDMKVDNDSFDYIFYTYGLSVYKNIPLIEPLEYKEVKKIREFVIAIDTSGSVQGSVVEAFLQKTYSILKEQESFFSKVNIHIIQCDDRIRSDVKITSQKEFGEYIRDIKIYGLGGTDFRPLFRYVDNLISSKEIKRLNGLIYFTDGYGDFPSMPKYKTAFVFLKDTDNNYDIPPWAMKVVLAEDFSIFYVEYSRYRKYYNIDEILSGRVNSETENRCSDAKTPEKIAVMHLLLNKILADICDYELDESITTELHSIIIEILSSNIKSNAIGTSLSEIQDKRKISLSTDNRQSYILSQIAAKLDEMNNIISNENDAENNIKVYFNNHLDTIDNKAKIICNQIDNIILFSDTYFKDESVTTMAVRKLTESKEAVSFLSQYPCVSYSEYCDTLRMNAKKK